MRSIERDHLIKRFDVDGDEVIPVRVAKRIIETEPTIDAVPIVHAHWIAERDPYGKVQAYHCSACYEKTGYYTYEASAYCPRCGTKMEGEIEDK